LQNCLLSLFLFFLTEGKLGNKRDIGLHNHPSSPDQWHTAMMGYVIDLGSFHSGLAFILVGNIGIDYLIILFHDRQEIFNHRHQNHRDVAGLRWDIATHLNTNGKLLYYFIP
jgi:hypothetical protein